MALRCRESPWLSCSRETDATRVALHLPGDTMQRDSLIILRLRRVQVCIDETLAFFSFHYRVRLRPFEDEIRAVPVSTTRRRQVDVRRRWEQLNLHYAEGYLKRISLRRRYEGHVVIVSSSEMIASVIVVLSK